MASKSYPRPGYSGGSISPLEHERLMAPALPEGVFGHPDDPGPVFADSTGTRLVKIRSQKIGYVRGSVYDSGLTDIPLPELAPNTSGWPRIDLVVLRLNRADYTVTEAVLTGAPAANPVAPTRSLSTGTTGFYEFPLADVRVDSGVTAIPASAVTTRAWYIGSDGQTRCTPSTRPEHEAGRSAWDTVYGYIVSTGARWLVAAEDSGDLAVPLASGWAAPAFNTLRRVNGLVYLAITLQRKVQNLGGSTVNCAHLPEGFRPSRAFESVAFAPSSGECRINVTTSGPVQVTCYGGITVDKYINIPPLVFPAAI